MSRQNPSDLRIIRLIFLLSLLCSIALSILMVYRTDRLVKLPVEFTLLALVAWPAMSYLYRKEKSLDIFLLLGVINFFVAVPELGLRVIDFRYISETQFGYPRPTEFLSYVPDEDLFWKFPATQPGINSLGFPGNEITIPKPKHTYRILYLGDSCTMRGYPGFAERYLNAYNHVDSIHYECTVLAITGYTSHQGLVMANMYGRRLEPDLAVVFFGWNDHWLAYGATDDCKKVTVPRSSWSKFADELYVNSRILQLARKIYVTAFQGLHTAPLDSVRVPLDRYRDNLEKIKAVFTSQNVPVIFITAPTALYRNPIPKYLISMKFARDDQAVRTLHRQYNEVVREIAKGEGVYLLDLEKEFESFHSYRDIFLPDCIHYTDFGNALIGQRVEEFIKANILSLSPAPAPASPVPPAGSPRNI